MTIAQIATQIFQELLSPTDITCPVIEYWLRSNVGMLNDRIGTYYNITSNQIAVDVDSQNFQESPDFGIDEAAIFKQLYKVKYYTDQINRMLGAAALDPVVEVSENGISVRRLSKNELAKTYRTLRKDEDDALTKLTKGYKRKHLTPLSVDGDDTHPFIQTDFNPIFEFNRRR